MAHNGRQRYNKDKYKDGLLPRSDSRVHIQSVAYQNHGRYLHDIR